MSTLAFHETLNVTMVSFLSERPAEGLPGFESTCCSTTKLPAAILMKTKEETAQNRQYPVLAGSAAPMPGGLVSVQ